MQLRELQRAFQDRILSFTNAIESELNESRNEDFVQRLDAYVGGYRIRLIEALGTTYPVLKTTLGDERFEREMRRFVDSTRSRHYSVRHFGAEVPQRMLACGPGEDGVALCELADWEWTLADVFDTRDDESLQVAALAAVPANDWPSLKFAARACVRRVETRSNVVEWWRAANGLCERPIHLHGASPRQWLLWRRGITTQFRSLDDMEAALLDATCEGATFGALCERVADFVEESEAALRAASFLKAWITEELLATCAWSEQPE